MILGKLLYYQHGASDKHVRGIAGVRTAGVVEVDRLSIDHFAEERGVTAEWRSILDKLGMP
ncbi:MAG: hypothetical protein AAGB00_00150 [Planctomycetota bacterium]